MGVLTPKSAPLSVARDKLDVVGLCQLLGTACEPGIRYDPRTSVLIRRSECRSAAELSFDGNAGHLPLDAEHPPLDASMPTWMPAGHLPGDARRPAPDIQCWMPARRRCAAPGQARPRDRCAVARPSGLDSTRSCPLQPVTSGPVGKGDAQADDVVWGKARWWRFPVALRDKELYGFEPLLPLRIGAIPHADEEVAVLCEELLRAFLARPEVEPEPRGVELKGNLGECTAGGRPGQGTRRGAVRIAGAWLMNREKRGTRRGSSRTVHEPDKSLRIWFIPWLTPRRGYSDARRPRATTRGSPTAQRRGRSKRRNLRGRRAGVVIPSQMTRSRQPKLSTYGRLGGEVRPSRPHRRLPRHDERPGHAC